MARKALLSVKLTAMLLMLSACGGSSGSTTAAVALTPQDALATATPIKHLVVIYGENESFDHYFGTYPTATNPTGEPTFTAASGTPTVNGLTPTLLTANPNVTNAANIAAATKGGFSTSFFNPFRIDRSQANTSSENHNYTPEQLAEDNGLMDAFPANTGAATTGGAGAFGTVAMVMGFFDGNTVTSLWNYAQNFAMNDSAFTETFGPSTPGAVEAVAGTNAGAVPVIGASATVPDGHGGYTLIGDTDPAGDTCSSKTATLQMTSKNIGDLLTAAGVTWGGFMGGFNLATTNSNATTGCARSTYSAVLAATKVDYVPHHNWFQYYASTANPAHTRPTSTALIGYTDPLDSTATPVHHEYDYNDFVAAVTSGNFPSVSYIKAPAVGDAHPGNSDPLDEQAFDTNLINFIQEQPDWKNTAIIIAYDDSDGWYDHQYATAVTSSFDNITTESIKTGTGTIVGADQLSGPGSCTSSTAVQGVGLTGLAINGRCGPGTRTPFIVISPYARTNYVDATPITQASIVRFIEDNWLGGARLGQGSHDATAGVLTAMFDFVSTGFAGAKSPRTVYLDPTLGTRLNSPPLTT
jgi:phospholipase C